LGWSTSQDPRPCRSSVVRRWRHPASCVCLGGRCLRHLLLGSNDRAAI